MAEDWKAKLGATFGVAPPAAEHATAGPPQPVRNALEQQGGERLVIVLDKKGRKGKQATIITGFKADDEAIAELAAQLKRQCGAGGSSRGGEVLLQGDFRQRVLDILQGMGFKAKVI